MDAALLVTGLVVLTATAFDFVNGFHDASNSIATIVATRVLSPRRAVLWASFFNFAALFLFSTGVAKTVGSGMIALETVTPPVILAGLIGAVAWGLITWRFGLPTSSSHALLGGYAGAAIAHSAWQYGWGGAFTPLILSGWGKTVLFMALAPVIGLVLAEIFVKTLSAAVKIRAPRTERWFGRLQLFSSAFLSLMHGTNDAQKTAGILTGTLVAAGYIDHFAIPLWVLLLSYTTMGFGTFFGGWRIVNTMGKKLTRLRPATGACAETAAGFSIMLATILNLPVSTTHVTTGAIVGVGAAQRLKAVRWKVAMNIVWAWLLTIPAAGLFGALMALAFYSARSFFHVPA